VTCVAVDSNADLVVSGSRDGTVIVHTLFHGRYLRTIAYPRADGGARRAVHLVAVNSNGCVLVYSRVRLRSRVAGRLLHADARAAVCRTT
jgi:hypothetical protein